MTDLIRLGIIGAGAIAHSYIKALETCQGAKLTAIADPRTDVAKAVAESARCRSYKSHVELAARDECDAVIVCTPPSSHTEIAAALLDKGIPVLCEKPLSTDVATARALCAQAQRKSVVLAMASKFRYVEDVIRAKSIIASGLVGDVILIENTFAATVDMSRRWNADPAISGGGVLIDNGTHSVDIVRYLVGPIVELMAFEGRRIQDLPVEDSVTLLMRTESGADASIDLSWSINKERDSYIRVYGSHGMVHVGWGSSRYRQLTSPDWIVFGHGYDKIAAFRSQLLNFCNNIRTGEPLLISPDDAVASVEVIQAAYQALGKRQWVRLRSAARLSRAAVLQMASA
jgi:predicted dehydrogenase